MKKLIIFICMLSAAAALFARGIQEDYKTAEDQARVSYAFGMIMGANLESMPIEFDYEAFSEGLRSMLEKGIEPQFSQQEAYEIVETALQQAVERLQDDNRRMEDEFLFTNSQREGVHVQPSGLQYEVIREARGEKPVLSSLVKVKYKGTFIDGSLFDSSEDDGSYIPLEMVIEGWSEGLMLMSVGSNYRLFIPSALAYGRDGIQGIIPPYSTLIFDVELLEISEGDY